ncbi:ALP1-like protein [Tanacetum coccineum]
MLGSINCMHWEWRNCPKAWHQKFGRGDKTYPTILLEAVASYDLWILHAFFRVAGANNDLTVLNNSPLFDDLLDGIDPVAPFECNGVTFEKGCKIIGGDMRLCKKVTKRSGRLEPKAIRAFAVHGYQ